MSERPEVREVPIEAVVAAPGPITIRVAPTARAWLSGTTFLILLLVVLAMLVLVVTGEIPLSDGWSGSAISLVPAVVLGLVAAATAYVLVSPVTLTLRPDSQDLVLRAPAFLRAAWIVPLHDISSITISGATRTHASPAMARLDVVGSANVIVRFAAPLPPPPLRAIVVPTHVVLWGWNRAGWPKPPRADRAYPGVCVHMNPARARTELAAVAAYVPVVDLRHP